MTMHAFKTASVVIIGGGASGVLLAAHILADPHTRTHVTIVEKSGRLGRGMAYATENPEHILNVPAKAMSAFPNDPDHFFRWLNARDATFTRDDFPPRARYGQYLDHLLEEAAQGGERLRTVTAGCTGLTETRDGVSVALDDGTRLMATAAVLAVGHEERQARGNELAVRAGTAMDTPLDPNASVLILGSGLSMVDAWLTLSGRRHCGPITVVSRNGLLPRAHARVTPRELAPSEIPLGTGLDTFVGWFRARVAETLASGGDWRAVVDGLRPYNQKIWQSWSIATRRRFLRYARPFWNIHRHRLPPALHASLMTAVDTGQMAIVAGEVTELSRDDGEIAAMVRRKGARTLETITADRVYDCGGVAVNVLQSSNPAVRSLVASGAARPDALKIGLDVTPDCAVIDRAGVPSRRVHAVGPLTRSQFFEIESVPEIRVQAQMLAQTLCGDAAAPPNGLGRKIVHGPVSR